MPFPGARSGEAATNFAAVVRTAGVAGIMESS